MNKCTKADVGYRETSCCGNCVFFNETHHDDADPSTCDLVEGTIDPGAVCDLFKDTESKT